MSSINRHRKPGASGSRQNVEVTPRKSMDDIRNRMGPAFPAEPGNFPAHSGVFDKVWVRSTVNFILDLEVDNYDDIRIFPRLAIFLLMALTIWSRNILVSNFDGLAIVHPDENFHAIEVAHTEVYGYGFRMHVYEPLPGSYIHENYSSEKKQVSWLYVHLYVVLFRLREYFNWSASPFVVARTFFSLWSAFLPFVVYKLGRALFKQSRDIGFVGASLVAFSKHTMIYGTHPFASSFAAPVVFLALVVALRTLSNAVCRRTVAESYTFDVLASAVVATCGFAIALAVAVKPDVVLVVAGFGMLFFPFRCAVGCLPTRPTLTFIISLLVGLILGSAVVTLHHHHLFGEWTVPFVSWLKEALLSRVEESPEPSTWRVLVGFLRCSHVHWVLLVSVILISCCYLARVSRLTILFDDWMSPTDSVMFSNVCRLGVLSTALAIAHTAFAHRREYAFALEMMVTSLLAGSGAVYLLFRRLYVYVVELAAPKQATKNVIKLILYGELFLYMFESRVTFPNSVDHTIADWSYGGSWESARVNQCLRFVGQQPDVTGVAVNYSIAMTGGYALLHRDVPILGRTFVDYREWAMSSRSNLSASSVSHSANHRRGVFGRNVSLASLDGVSDLVSLDNGAYFYRQLIENPVYNYVVTNGTSARLFRTGFREVYNASDFRVFKRTKSRTEREALSAIVTLIPTGSDAAVLAEEGRRLTALLLFDKAAHRLRASVDLDAANVEVWRLLLAALTQLERYDELATSRDLCRQHHGAQCVTS